MRLRIILIAALGIFGVAQHAGAQGFDPKCQQYQLKQFNWLSSRIGDISPEQHAQLRADKKLAQEFIDRGQRLNREIEDVRTRIAGEIRANLERDPTYGEVQAREAQAKRKAAETGRFEDVREWQEDKAELERLRNARIGPGLVRNKDVDTKFAAGNELSRESGLAEADMYLRRVHTNLSPQAKAAIVQKTLADSAKALGLDRTGTKRIEENPAWSQAVGVLGVLRAVARSGHVKEEVVKGLPSQVFDSDASIVAASLSAVSANALVGGMIIDGTTSSWGGSRTSPTLRGSMGPATEKSVGELASESLSLQGRVIDVTGKVKKAMAMPPSRIERMPVPAPSLIAPKTTRFERRMEQVEQSAKAAVRELTRYGSVNFDTSIRKYLGRPGQASGGGVPR